VRRILANSTIVNLADVQLNSKFDCCRIVLAVLGRGGIVRMAVSDSHSKNLRSDQVRWKILENWPLDYRLFANWSCTCCESVTNGCFRTEMICL